MTIEYDEKGKFFTDIIRKTPLYVTVQTTSHLIQGLVHLRPGARLKDELDQDELFIAITEAKILGADGKPLYQIPFLAVLRSHVIWVFPEDENVEK
jgi:hypothetical protein